MFLFFNASATTVLYTYGHTRSLHDALPILNFRSGTGKLADIFAGIDSAEQRMCRRKYWRGASQQPSTLTTRIQHRTPPMPYRPIGKRTEEHTSELQSLMRSSYAVLSLEKKKHKRNMQRKNTEKYSKR